MSREARLGGAGERGSTSGRSFTATSCARTISLSLSPCHFALTRRHLSTPPPQRSAIRTLHTVLSLSSPHLTPSPFPLASPPPESHTRAPCSNDACLFTTSLTPFPPASALAASYAAEPAGARSSAGGRAVRAWRALVGGRGASVIDVRARGEVQHHARVLREQRRALDATRGRPSGLDPLAEGWTVREHEARWNELLRPREGVAGGKAFGTGTGGAMESAWPDEGRWVRNGSWHLAVDGRGTDTCWESFRRAFGPLSSLAWARLADLRCRAHAAPEAEDHFGLTFVRPRTVRELTIVGSLDLANIAAWEDLSGGGDSWEVLSVRGDGTGGWVRLPALAL